MLQHEVAKGQLYWQGKALYAANQPCESVLRKLPSTWEEACLYVVPGPALGHGLAEILAQLPVTSRLLLLEWDCELAVFSQHWLEKQGLLDEPCVQFLALQQFEDPEKSTSALDRNAKALVLLYKLLQPNSGGRGDKDRIWLHWACRRIRTLSLNRCFALQRAYFQPILEWLEIYIQNFWQNRLTLDKLGPLWLRNFFRNLEQLPNCLPTKICAAGIVLVAAGPSLEWHYQWLRKERKYYTLLTVDTALLPLLKAGIVPDYVINLDAQVLNLLDFYDAERYLAQQSSSLCQIADLSCDPRSFAALRQPFQLTATQFAPMRLWQRFAKLQKQLQPKSNGPFRSICLPLEPLGSVALSSLAIALHCQPSFVLFVGYDFAYPLDLQHVRGSSIQQKLLHVSNRLQPANSCAASLLRRPILGDTERSSHGLWRGFVSDQVLQGYATQLQNYLQRSTDVRFGRLAGPLSSTTIPELNYEQASRALHAAVLAGNLAQHSPLCEIDRAETLALVQKFWQEEWEILEDLQASILSGEIQKGEEWWYSRDYAADYLLRLCLPKAGYTDSQVNNWSRLLQLSQNFATLLGALLRTQAS